MASSVKFKQKNPRAIDKLSKLYKKNDHVLEVGYPKELVGSVVYPSVRDPKNPSQFIKSESPPRVTDVAYMNEMGSISRGVPARSFMHESSKPAAKLMKQQQTKLTKQLNQKAASPQIFVKFLRIMGPKMAAIFQKTIVDFREPPNAPSTVAIKGSDNPLIDTGLMRQTLTYLVTKRKKSK